MVPGDETDLHTLVGAYAMDAVGTADRARFEQHLAACDECREEIRGLREATARLGQAAAIQPRAELRDATLRAAALTRQLPPAVRAQPAPAAPGAAAAADAPDAAADAAADARRGPTGGRSRSAARAGRAARGTGSAARRMPRTLTGRWPRLALAVAGALAAAVVVLGTMMHGTQHQLDQVQGRSHAIAEVLNATDVTMLTADVSTGGTATVVMSHRQQALVFTAKGLRLLPAARRYELWLIGPAGVRPAGTLPASSAGMVGPMVVSGLAAGDRIGLTVEPASGSRRPTSPPVLMLGLSSR